MAAREEEFDRGVQHGSVDHQRHACRQKGQRQQQNQGNQHEGNAHAAP